MFAFLSLCSIPLSLGMQSGFSLSIEERVELFDLSRFRQVVAGTLDLPELISKPHAGDCIRARHGYKDLLEATAKTPAIAGEHAHPLYRGFSREESVTAAKFARALRKRIKEHTKEYFLKSLSSQNVGQLLDAADAAFDFLSSFKAKSLLSHLDRAMSDEEEALSKDLYAVTLGIALYRAHQLGAKTPFYFQKKNVSLGSLCSLEAFVSKLAYLEKVVREALNRPASDLHWFNEEDLQHASSFLPFVRNSHAEFLAPLDYLKQNEGQESALLRGQPHYYFRKMGTDQYYKQPNRNTHLESSSSTLRTVDSAESMDSSSSAQPSTVLSMSEQQAARQTRSTFLRSSDGQASSSEGGSFVLHEDSYLRRIFEEPSEKGKRLEKIQGSPVGEEMEEAKAKFGALMQSLLKTPKYWKSESGHRPGVWIDVDPAAAERAFVYSAQLLREIKTAHRRYFTTSLPSRPFSCSPFSCISPGTLLDVAESAYLQRKELEGEIRKSLILYGSRQEEALLWARLVIAQAVPLRAAEERGAASPWFFKRKSVRNSRAQIAEWNQLGKNLEAALALKEEKLEGVRDTNSLRREDFLKARSLLGYIDSLLVVRILKVVPSSEGRRRRITFRIFPTFWPRRGSLTL